VTSSFPGAAPETVDPAATENGSSAADPAASAADPASQGPGTASTDRAPGHAAAPSAARGPAPPSDDDALIRARGLTKRFGDFTAVDGVDFDVATGEAFGFLGPNGAGKTSTMRMIGCVSPVTEGSLRVLGLDPATDGARIRAQLGVVPQQDNLDTELTVLENLLIYARYFEVPRAEANRRAKELLEFVQLADRSDSQVEPLSGGMKRRLTIARALIADPTLVLLDEPTTGLDPQARHLLWERLYQLKRQGSTLVLTTHYMDEAEQLCDRLVVMDNAKIVAEGSPRQLIDEHVSKEVLELRFDDGVDVDAVIGGVDFGQLVERTEQRPDRILLYTADGEAAVERLHAAGVHPESSLIRRATLEDVFLRLTGRTLVD
jgi:lipooligosaccharide transport system ATP-binding protein